MAGGRFATLIAELQVTRTDADKEKKKVQVAEDFKGSDARLTELVVEHKHELSKIVEEYSRASRWVASSREKCKSVKEKLMLSMELLQCKRDELKSLWMESLEHQQIHAMLGEISNMKSVPVEVKKYLVDGELAKATDVLVSSLTLVEGHLSPVEALKDLKSELYTLKGELHRVLIQELRKQLYMTPSDVFLQRSGNEGSMENLTYEGVFGNRNFSTLTVVGEFFHSVEDSVGSESMVALECVSMLKLLPETIDILKEGCCRELMGIVRNSSQLMHNILQSSFDLCSNKSAILELPEQQLKHCFHDLMEAILDQFRHVARNHRSFLKDLQTVVSAKRLEDLSYYHMDDIYSNMQATIEAFLGNYLDLQSSVAWQRQVAPLFSKSPSVTDITLFFLPKSNFKSKNVSLFKFDSSHGTRSYVQDQKSSENQKEDTDFINSEKSNIICQPTASNITIIYKPLRNFVSEIEQAICMEPGAHCPLHTFLLDSVNNFLDHVNVEVNRLLGNVSTSMDIWKPLSDVDALSNASCGSAILDSAFILNKSLKELQKLIYFLPDYSNHISHVICNILLSYKELCHQAFKNLVFSEGEDQSIFSVSWARDKDISRLLKSFPNWANLEKTGEGDIEEFPEDIWLRNKEESDLLIRNVSSSDQSDFKILTDVSQLHNLALMEESMLWFSHEILDLLNGLPQESRQSTNPCNTQPFNKVSIDSSVLECLNKMAKDYEDLADSCILVLHLEVRAHCFYYLHPLSEKGPFANRNLINQGPDQAGINLRSDLLKIDEALSPVLKLKKFKYIFEGVGELISAILINSLPAMNKITETDVKKMERNIFAIQQCLSGITMTREVSLDRARQYFELLNFTYREIIDHIVEGPRFLEHEYAAVFKLLHDSKDNVDQDALSYVLDKMRRIFKTFAEAV